MVDQLGEVTEALQSLARVDTTLTAVHLEVQSMLEQAGDLAKRLRVYRESIEFNPRRLDEVEERLALLRNLKRKYGDNLQAVLEHAEAAREELETLTNAEQRMAELEAQQEQLLRALGTVGAQLSEGRHSGRRGACGGNRAGADGPADGRRPLWSGDAAGTRP